MSYLELCNEPWLYIPATGIIFLVCIQAIVMSRRAWQHAHVLGCTTLELRRALATGILVSIFPTIPVVITMLALIPLLGAPLPWLRLSVIGGPPGETLAAYSAVEAMGETLSVNGYSAESWVAAVWVMCFACTTAVIFSIVFCKPIAKVYEGGNKIDSRLATIIGAGCLTGVMAYSGTSFGLSAIPTKGLVFGISFLAGVVMTVLAKKLPKQKWMSEALMAVSMIVGMVFACILFK